MPAKKAAAKKTTAKKPAAKRGRKTGSSMSDEHKAALASGRESGRAVRSYLDALESHKPKRGRKRTKESIAARLVAIDTELALASPIVRLGLIQEQLDLTAEREAMDQVVDLSALEAQFVKHAKAYGTSKGISYAAWRSVGVSAEVLRSAGISR